MAWYRSHSGSLGPRLRFTGGSMTRNRFTIAEPQFFRLRGADSSGPLAPAQTLRRPFGWPLLSTDCARRGGRTGTTRCWNPSKSEPSAGLPLLGDSITQNDVRARPPAKEPARVPGSDGPATEAARTYVILFQRVEVIFKPQFGVRQAGSIMRFPLSPGVYVAENLQVFCARLRPMGVTRWRRTPPHLWVC